KQIFKFTIILNVLIYLTLLLFTKDIVLLLGGQQMLEAIMIVNILALTAPIVAMSNIFGIQLLIPFGYSDAFKKVILTSGLVYLTQVLFIYATWGFSLLNISIVTVTT